MALHAGTGLDPAITEAFDKATKQAGRKKGGCCGGGGGSGSIIRALVLVHSGEAMVLAKQYGGSVGYLGRDWDRVIKGLDEATPAYVLIKADYGSWYFLTYVPEDTDVTTRMIMGSSVGSVKAGLGAHKFIEVIQGEKKSELTYGAYQKSQEIDDSMLTERERVARQLANENYDHLSPPSKSQRKSKNPVMAEFMQAVPKT